MSEKDFWCLRWGANLDVRGQDLMNEVGNTIQEKRASVEPDIGFDGSDRPPQVGDFILTNEDSTFGHFALINDIRTDPKTGKKVAVLSESNYKPLTVDHTRTITLDSSNMEKNGGKILGFKHSELKPEYTNQPESELSGGFTRPTKEAKETTTMSVPQQTMLRTEIAKDKAIVQYSDLNNTFESMDAIAQTALAKPTKESRASLDQALVTLFNKMLDPTSVVREGEYARTAEGQSVLTRAEGFKAKLQQGGAGITDATRRDMVEVSRILRDVAEGQYQDSVDFYIPIIEQGGLEPSKFIKGYGTSPTRSGTSDALKTQYPQYSNDIQSMLDEGFSLDEIEEALSGL